MILTQLGLRIGYRFGGKEMGYVGNNGTLDTSYQTSIYNRVNDANPLNSDGAFRYNSETGTPHVVMDPSLSSITSYHSGSQAGSYTVRNWDMLVGIIAVSFFS